MGCTNTKILPQEKVEERKEKESAELKASPRNAKRQIVPSVCQDRKSSSEILQELMDVGFLNNPKASSGGVAFSVGNTDSGCAPPRRLAKLELSESAHKREMKIFGKLYDAERRRMFRTTERRAKLAERQEMRESVLLKKEKKETEKKERDDKCLLKHYDAERRLMCKEAERKAKVEEKNEQRELVLLRKGNN